MKHIFRWQEKICYLTQITQHKQAVINGYQNMKQIAANDVDFWEKALKQCKDNFENILTELEK